MHDKAILYYHQALRGYEAVLGRNHLTTLAVANDLGVVYYSKGDLSMCSRLYQRVLLGREKVRRWSDEQGAVILIRRRL